MFAVFFEFCNFHFYFTTLFEQLDNNEFIVSRKLCLRNSMINNKNKKSEQ